MKLNPISYPLAMLLCILSHQADADQTCDSTVNDSSHKKLPTVESPEALKILPITTSGKTKCLISTNYKDSTTNSKLRTEEGIYQDIKYRIYYSDGSGTIQGSKSSKLEYSINDNWNTRCDFDGMDDSHWCSMQKGNIYIGIWKDGSSYIQIGSNNFPGTDILVRVDKNGPIKAKADPGYTTRQTDKLIAQFKTGNTALSRYIEWPHERNKDLSIDLYGFNQAWEILNIIYKSAGNQK